MACADVSYSLVMTHHGEKALKKKALPEILATPKLWGMLLTSNSELSASGNSG